MENLCRTCLRARSKLLPLNDYENLVNKIEIISSIQITANDSYPSGICEECAYNVNKFFCFRKVIINSDKELKERHDTLQRTNFTAKPRTKPTDLKEDFSIVKQESETQPNNDTNDDDSYISMTVEDIENGEDSANDDHESDESKVNFIKSTIARLTEPKCTECNLSFTSRLKLYNHRRTVHIAPGVCNICGLVVRADNLKRHVQMHSEGPVTCKICGKVFKNPESLRGHLLIHKGLLFTCEVCGKTSRVKSEHHRHMKTHLDPEARKTICPICGKRVRDRKKHMQSHTGERPHTCSYCSKGFTSPYALKVHTRQHTNEKPFICECCSMAFPQKVSLTTHLKSKHNVTSV